MARILIVEDNAPNLDLMCYLLTAFGHAVTSTGDGLEAVPLVLAQQPDLVLCDVNLPGRDGCAIAFELKADPRTQAIPLVAVTALAMPGDRERIRAAGFDGYIAKPIEPDAFVPTVERYLDGPAQAVRACAEAAAPAHARTPEAGGYVLAVDDAEANREFYHALLEPSGYRVSTHARIDEAVRAAAADRPDLVITDLHIPGGDGVALLHALRADPALRDVPVVIVSSSSWGREDRERALQSGAARFLLRPIEPQALLDEIMEVLRSKP